MKKQTLQDATRINRQLKSIICVQEEIVDRGQKYKKSNRKETRMGEIFKDTIRGRL